jgi:hypothetical protein
MPRTFAIELRIESPVVVMRRRRAYGSAGAIVAAPASVVNARE